MKEVENYVHSKLDQPLSVEEISTRFHISPKYLSNIFKAEKGESLASWIIDRKINKACHLLVTQEDNSITEIARQVGYHDPRYFSRLFRKKTGLTPTDYRSRHLPLV
ncbi:MAG TPA: helix-turn-helix transcriptional regulator [Firmicutes bacterium]|nr:helix-turn-helix transcriptional regulator [Bacillota bacterium]